MEEGEEAVSDENWILVIYLEEDGKTTTRVNVSAFEQPATWGIVLMDVVRYIGDGISKLASPPVEAKQIVDEIHKFFNSEYAKDTGYREGGLES